jgi:hypothetical protein
MEVEAHHAGLAAPFRDLQANVPESGMRIVVSPLDPRFPQLVRMSDPAQVHDMLAENRPASARSKAPCRVSTVRYRPGRRHVLRYDIGDGGGRDGGSETIFAKLYRNGESQGAFRLAEAIADGLTESGSPVSAAAPLSVVEDGDSVLFRGAPGEPLSIRIARGLSDLATHLHRSGQALRILQSGAVSPPDRIPVHGFDADLKRVAGATEHIRALLPGPGSAIREIVDRGEGLYERVFKEPLAFAHGDYKCDHLFLGPGGSLTLIDFNACAMADPALDVGKFLADLDWWFAVSGRDGVETSKRAFLEGYGTMPEHRMLRARLFEALILTKITGHRIPIFDPAWEQRTTRLIALAGALMDRLQGDADPDMAF